MVNNNDNFDNSPLKENTILSGQYKISEFISSNVLQKKYIGHDVKDDSTVFIYEYFPENLVKRANNGMICFQTNSKADVFAKSLNAYVEQMEKLKNIDDLNAIEDIKDLIIENNTCYVVSPYEKQITLAEYLKSRKELSVSSAKKIFDGIAKTMKVLHKNNIVHGNLSPDHIVVLKGNNIKIVDFGVGCYINSTSMPIFNPRFSPIETTEDGAYVDVRSDIYSLGALYYRLLSGIKPYSALERKSGKVNIPLRELGIDIPKAMDNAIQNAMCIDIDNRYSTIDELYRALNSKKEKLIREEYGSVEGKNRLGINNDIFIISAAIAFVVLLVIVISVILLLSGKKDNPSGVNTETGAEGSIQTEAAMSDNDDSGVGGFLKNLFSGSSQSEDEINTVEENTSVNSDDENTSAASEALVEIPFKFNDADQGKIGRFTENGINYYYASDIFKKLNFERNQNEAKEEYKSSQGTVVVPLQGKKYMVNNEPFPSASDFLARDNNVVIPEDALKNILDKLGYIIEIVSNNNGNELRVKAKGFIAKSTTESTTTTTTEATTTTIETTTAKPQPVTQKPQPVTQKPQPVTQKPQPTTKKIEKTTKTTTEITTEITTAKTQKTGEAAETTTATATVNSEATTSATTGAVNFPPPKASVVATEEQSESASQNQDSGSDNNDLNNNESAEASPAEDNAHAQGEGEA